MLSGLSNSLPTTQFLIRNVQYFKPFWYTTKCTQTAPNSIAGCRTLCPCWRWWVLISPCPTILFSKRKGSFLLNQQDGGLCLLLPARRTPQIPQRCSCHLLAPNSRLTLQPPHPPHTSRYRKTESVGSRHGFTPSPLNRSVLRFGLETPHSSVSKVPFPEGNHASVPFRIVSDGGYTFSYWILK